MGKEGAMMIDYIVDIIFWGLMLSGMSFVFGYNYAQREAFRKYEEWRLAVSRERLRRIREW